MRKESALSAAARLTGVAVAAVGLLEQAVQDQLVVVGRLLWQLLGLGGRLVKVLLRQRGMQLMHICVYARACLGCTSGCTRPAETAGSPLFSTLIQTDGRQDRCSCWLCTTDS
jgi:hypothetical protein